MREAVTNMSDFNTNEEDLENDIPLETEEIPVQVEDDEEDEYLNDEIDDLDDFFNEENEDDSESNELPVNDDNEDKVVLSEEAIANLKKFIKDKGFISSWQQLKSNISDTLNLLLDKSGDKVKMLGIREIIEEMLNSSNEELDFSNILSLTEVENEGLTELTSNIIDFLSNITILSLLGGLETDVNTKLIEFGFYDFASNLTGVVSVTMGIEREEAKSKFLKGVLANMRSSDTCQHLNDYIAQGCHYKDINYIVALLDKKEQNKYEKVLHEYVENSTILGDDILHTIDSIMAIYDALFQDGSGVKPYYGVLTNSDGAYSYTLRSSNGDSVENIVTDRVYNDNLARVLTGLKQKGYNLGTNIIISENRQFDEQLIIDSDKPVYFPRKILEFALCMKATKNQSVCMYSPADMRGGYAKSKFREGMRETISKVVKDGIMYLIRKVTNNNPKDFVVLDHPNEIQTVLNKLKISLCTAFLITDVKLTRRDGFPSLASEKIRFCDTNSVFSGTAEETRELLFIPVEFTADAPVDCSKGIRLEDKSNTQTAFNVWQYEFIRDFESATREPLFSYTVVDQLLSRNIELSWNNALIGELETGRILFSVPEPKTSGQISLGRHIVHNLIAGSRAGKGLQTMGHSANLVAEGRPIFYIDRKPDMGAMLAEITKGNMFVINGGKGVDTKIDYLGTFEFRDGGDEFHEADGTPITLSGWNKRLPLNLINLLEKKSCEPSDLLEEQLSRIKEAKYYGSGYSIADLVYLRSVYFCLALICLRTDFKGVPEVYNNLGGDEGIAIVIDEFSNWHRELGSAFSFKNELAGLVPDPTSFKAFLADMKNEKKREDALKARKQWGLTGRPYIFDLCSCIDNIAKKLSSLKDAGLQGDNKLEQNWITDIYIIGQNAMAEDYKDVSGVFNWGATTITGAKTVNKIPNATNPSIVRQTLAVLKQDWFLGREFTGTEIWSGVPSRGSLSNSLYNKLEKGYWLYSTSNHADIKSASFSKMNYEVMKPYLVLNNCIEPDFDAEDGQDSKTLPKNAQFLRNCVSRIGLSFWKDIRLKHTKTPQTAENPIWGDINEGLGFVGLVKKAMKASGKYTGDNDYLTVLEKSSNIANYVARKCGYDSWREFIFDFTPTGLFDYDSLKSALADPGYNYQATENVRVRAQSCTVCDCLYPDLLFGSMSADETATELSEDSFINNDEFRVNLDDFEDEEFSESNTKGVPPVENKDISEEDARYIEAWRKELDRQALNELIKSNKQIEDAFKIYVDREIKANAFEGEDLEEFKQGTNEMLQGYLNKNKIKIYEFRDNLLAKAEAENYKTILANRG